MFVIVYSRFEATARLQSVEFGALMPGFSALNLPWAAGTAVTSTRTSLHNAVHCIQEWPVLTEYIPFHSSPCLAYILTLRAAVVAPEPLPWIYNRLPTPPYIYSAPQLHLFCLSALLAVLAISPHRRRFCQARVSFVYSRPISQYSDICLAS